MARRRYQKGHVYLDGENWEGRYREGVISTDGVKRVRQEVILSSRREMTKPPAERRMEIVLAKTILRSRPKITHHALHRSTPEQSPPRAIRGGKPADRISRQALGASL